MLLEAGSRSTVDGVRVGRIVHSEDAYVVRDMYIFLRESYEKHQIALMGVMIIHRKPAVQRILFWYERRDQDSLEPIGATWCP